MLNLSNSFKALIGLLSLIVVFGVGYYKGNYDRGLKDNINAYHMAIRQKDKTIAILNYQAELNESANANLIIQLNTLNAEYVYANTVITKYQKRLNDLTHIDPSFVRYIQYIQSTDRMPSVTAYASLFIPTTESATASGILRYITSLKQWGENCVIRDKAKTDWYNSLREQYK